MPKYMDDIAFSDGAKWIDSPDGIYRWQLFRREYVYTGGRAVLLLCARTYACVYINGREALRYALHGFVYDRPYETADITEYLNEGTNTVLVLTHGFRGEAKYDLRLEISCPGGQLLSDGSWKTRPCEALSYTSNFFFSSFGGEEIFDARAFDEHVYYNGFDDAAWENAVVTDGGEYVIFQSKLNLQTRTERLPVSAEARYFARKAGLLFALPSKPGCCGAYRAVVYAPRRARAVFSARPDSAEVYMDGRVYEGEIPRGKHEFVFYAPNCTGNIECFFECDAALKLLKTRALYAPAKPVEFPWNEAAPDNSCPRLRDALLGGEAGDEVSPAEPSHLFRLKYLTRPAEPICPDLPMVIDAARDGAVITFDFGHVLLGMPCFEITAKAGTVAELNGYEVITDNGIKYIEKNVMTYICREGRQTYTVNTRHGMRYFELRVNGGATVHGARYISFAYDTVEAAPFSSNDPALDAAYAMSLRTARVCMPDSYIDCPSFEQNIWVGDARVTAANALINMGAYEFDKRYLYLAGESLTEPFKTDQWGKDAFFGRNFTYACWPRYPRGGIPIWSFQWVLQTYDHYMATGDKACLARDFALVKIQLDNCFAITDDRGLLKTDGSWSLIEWAENDILMCGEVTANTVMFISCLRAAALEARELGLDARLFEGKINEYTRAVNTYCVRDGVYIDSPRDEYAYGQYTAYCARAGRRPMEFGDFAARKRVSVQTNTLAYLAGIIPKENEDKCLAFLTDNIENGTYESGSPARMKNEARQSYVPIGSPFFLFFAYEALARRGRRDLILKSIRRDYGLMREKGTTTCWESFYTPGDWTRSIAHGWASAPSVYLKTEILGIKPLSPGYRTFTVEPYMADITEMSGGVMTPYGEITLRVSRDGINVVHPEGTQYIKR